MVEKIEHSMEQVEQQSKEHDQCLEDMKKIIDQTTKTIETLKQTDEQQRKAVEQLSDSVTSIHKSLNDFKAENKEQVVASYSSTLYRLYMEAVSKGYTDRAALETFSNMSDIYLKNGGNSVFKNKIIPQYMELPIKGIDDELDESK
jgi:methyl-accepting chemotaxis protein